MSIRGELMDEAKRLTEGDRNETHGDPTVNMRIYGELLAILGEFVLPDSVAGALSACMHKMARIMQNPGHRDSYIDLIAYAGIAGEAAEKEGLFDPLNSEPALDTKPVCSICQGWHTNAEHVWPKKNPPKTKTIAKCEFCGSDTHLTDECGDL